MKQLTIKTGTTEDFFRRGRELASAADRGAPLAESNVISFEDPADLMKLITAGRLALFRAVKEMPGSITEVANRLHRNRRAVKRDIDALAEAGLITVAPRILPGHGQQKEVRAVATQIRLQAEV